MYNNATDVVGVILKKAALFLGVVLGQISSLGFANTLLGGSPSQTLELAAQLERAGAADLALEKISYSLLELPSGSPLWLSMKQKQVALLREQGRYQELTQLLTTDVAQTQNPSHRRWLQNQQISNALDAGEAQQAITYIRKALWEYANSYDPEVLDAIANWRRQLVEARVLAGQIDLAADTLARYERDYQIASDDSALRPGIQRWPWKYQPRFNQELKRSRARLFLESGEFTVAAQLLRDDKHPKVQLVRLLALLRTGQLSPAQVYQQVVVLAEDKQYDLPERKSAWVLAAESAGLNGQVSQQIQALKNALVLAPQLPFSEPLMSTDAATSWLWMAQAGQQLMTAWGREQSIEQVLARLSSGNWGVDQQQAVLAGLYAQAANAEQQSRILMALVNVESDATVRRRLVPDWLLENQYVTSNTLSPALRYRLTELLLEAGAIPRAAELMAQLDSAPANVPPVEWQLRRARVLILAAKADAGVQILQTLLDGNYGALPDVDRFLQAVFDVQAVGAHNQAIGLFQRLLEQPLEDRQRREMHYWLADASKAAENYHLAAEHYLLSAGEQLNSWDQWGVSARRQAAEVLKEAGLLEDAINIYQRLLDRSEDRTERAVLRTNIQRLKAQL